MSVYEFIPKPGAPYDRTRDLVKRHEHDVVNFYIGTARGNAMWDLTWVYANKPLVPRGPNGSFDKDMIFPASQIITHNDKHWIYYSGHGERHGVSGRGKPGIGLATLELDRFMCLEAKDQPGTVVTKPFKLAGDKLQVNVKGDILVEVLNRKGEPIPGFSAKQATQYKRVDELRLTPTWKNGSRLSTLKGSVIRLRFHLRNARLYSFQIPK